MNEEFFALVERLCRELQGGERLLCTLSGERSDFVRFNHGKVRQAGSVTQRAASLRLIDGRRQASAGVTLSGTPEDLDLCRTQLRALRDVVREVPEDPWLLINETPVSTNTARRGRLASAAEVVEQAVDEAAGRDFVGIYAGGTLYRAFANSLGQRNAHEVDSFNFDWSLYREADQAVKSGYAGFDWDAAAFRARVGAAASELERLAIPRKTLEPGEYRAFLTPRALEDIVGMLSWGGFSARARATKQSPLLRMEQGERLSSAVTLLENTVEGVAPAFQGDGFAKPDRVVLVDQGALGHALASPRSAKEYGYPNNAANGGEGPESIDLAGGALEAKDVLPALDRGLYISNLWYLNYSDRPAGRMTGMTRFATFWVEGARIVAPVTPMRFDDSIFRILGARLAALTRDREMLLDPTTYDERSTASSRLPGALLDGLVFTL